MLGELKRSGGQTRVLSSKICGCPQERQNAAANILQTHHGFSHVLMSKLFKRLIWPSTRTTLPTFFSCFQKNIAALWTRTVREQVTQENYTRMGRIILSAAADLFGNPCSWVTFEQIGWSHHSTLCTSLPTSLLDPTLSRSSCSALHRCAHFQQCAQPGGGKPAGHRLRWFCDSSSSIRGLRTVAISICVRSALLEIGIA